MTTVAELIRERFGSLTEIQKLAMPKILAGENVLVLAPTGSGKTEAVILPVLEKVDRNAPGIQALYITPLRSLNRDLLKRFSWWCERLGISHAVRHGDTTQSERDSHRKNPPQILLTTCESLQALLVAPIMRRHITNVRFVICDEIHDILDNKRGAQLSFGLERLSEIAKFQRIGITATVANEREAGALLFGEREYEIAETGKNRKFELEICDVMDRTARIGRIKKESETHRSLIFVNTRSTAEELGADLKAAGAPVEVHHGSLSKEVRISAEDRFKSGEVRSLLATSSLELGIDIGDIDLIVQFNSPRQAFRLLQRIGRSGHALDKTPKGVIVPENLDEFIEATAINIRAENGWMENKLIERGALDVIAHQVVGLLLEYGRTELSAIHKLFSRSAAYSIGIQKLKKISLQLHDEGLIYCDDVSENDANLKATPRAREYYFSNLSTIPKERRFLLRDLSSNRPIASLGEEFVSNLDEGTSFLSKGQPWRVIDITETEIIAEPSFATDIAIPEWAGEDIPVDFEIARDVGRLRSGYSDADTKFDSRIKYDTTIIIEIIEDLVVIHSCSGTRVNQSLARILSFKISELIGESVRAVADPYRVMMKFPYPLDEKHIRTALLSVGSVQSILEESIHNSSLLRNKFINSARLFGLLGETAIMNSRLINFMRNSVVYEEAMRSIFFRYFDAERTQQLIDSIKSGSTKIIIDKRMKPGKFAELGISRASGKGGGEAMGGFEPRAQMIEALRERTLTKTLQLQCFSCGSTQFLHLAGAQDFPKCHRCKSGSLFIMSEKFKKPEAEKEYESGLVRNFGKRALLALSCYGVGARTADTILSRLPKDDETFWWSILEAQRNFAKNKKYWKI
ncbi:TPA: DEAD/DEAH box helicase [Candidatus Micrarchaeota archaeon]|nr:DEAD/DEAH box helicase [Candidatus Micrarchaeota archaeon]